jgi:hypothetical protein
LKTNKISGKIQRLKKILSVPHKKEIKMIKSIKAKYSRSLLLLIIFALFCCLVACGGSKDTGTTPITPTTPTADSISLSASPASINSDGSTTSTIKVNALNSSNAMLSGITVTLSTDTGVLSAASVVTDSTTPATVTLSYGGNQTNRTVTITATAGTVSAQIPLQVVGSTVTLASSASSIPNDNATTVTLTATVKDAGNHIVPGAAVTLTQSGVGSVTITNATGTTDSSGIFTTTVTGAITGAVTITATALGATATTALTVTPVNASFAIDQLTLDTVVITIPSNKITAMTMNASATPFTPHSLNIRVNAPSGITHVTFATTIGLWDSTSTVVTKTVSGGKASATLTTTQTGVANIQVYNATDANTQDTFTVAMSSGAAPNKIILQASPTVVPVSVGGTTGSSTLTATVYDASNNPLGGQPVAFSIVDGTSTSGGETVSPVVQITGTDGKASTIFNSGSIPSSGSGVKIRAYIVGTTAPEVRTGLSPSGNDGAIIIGGVAGSIAFGMDSKSAEDSTGANYVYKMSVLVADANGNPVARTPVTLGVWPVAWCTGSSCACDADTATTGTFWNEDRNENLILDTIPAPQEDGARCHYADATKCSGGGWLPGGNIDGLITPTNSAGGTVPASVTTDANGVAGFQVTYPKSSGMWIYDRVRATTTVQGSETRAEIIIYLRVVVGEEAICAFSPYKF